MAAQTGKTNNFFIGFLIDDSGGTLREIPVNSIGNVGHEYDEHDVTAFQDAVKNFLTGQPIVTGLEISGPFDDSAAAAPPTLSGSHTVLNGIKGLNTPLTLDVQFGMRHAWEAGEPQFGITSTATDGVICKTYTVDPNTGLYTAVFAVIGATLPDWGTAAET